MPDFRSYHEQAPTSTGEQITLTPEESNHLVAANRARTGDPVALFDGQGTECKTRLAIADKRKAVLEIQEITKIHSPTYKIALAQALPKGKLLETIIRKATEIGAQQIFPISTQRCEVKVDAGKKKTKDAKWSAAALEGAKQSGNPHLVSIESVSTFSDFIDLSSDFELKLIASLEPNAQSLKRHLSHFKAEHEQALPKSAICLIGPEGDFTPEEYQKAYENGFLPTSLGNHVMRSETAAIHALSIIQYELTTD